MSQLRVSTVATTAGVINLTTNSIGADPSNAIALHASRNGSGSGISDGTYIKWNGFHISSPYYNASTGLFTAPIAGKYFVSAHVITNTPGSAYFYLYKNGSQVSFSHLNMSGTWGHLTITGIVNCAINDTFGVGMQSDDTYYGNDHNGYTVMYLGA